MKLFNYVTAAALAVGGITMAGCRDDGRTTDKPTENAGNQTQHSANKAGQAAENAANRAGQATENAAERAGQATNNAAQKTGDALNNAAQKTGEAANNAAQKTGEAARNTGNALERGKDAVVAAVTPSGSSDVTGMRGAMEGIVQNALDAGNFKVMTNHLTKADRERLEAAAPDEMPQLDQAAKQFKDAWRAKYGGDAFGVMDGTAVFNEQFVTLESPDNMKTGTATIKASHGMPEVKLPFVAEDGKWRLDVKDTLDAKTLRQNLLQAATELNTGASSWPADKVEAARVVSHKIFMAVSK